MAETRGSGKLAVILHADVAGSTALVQQDEHLAHERIQDAFRRFSDTITQYHGHVRELRGDALLAEFDRASDAVCAALYFQQLHTESLEQFNDEIKPDIRVGVSLGEVVFADDTVTGAGVVLAQRVEQLAEPGGLCITAAIHEALPKRMPFDQANLGEQELKGFDEPVRVYRVGLKPGESIPPPEQSSKASTSSTYWRFAIATVATVVVVTSGVLLWFKPWEVREDPASVERMTFPLPEKPSIAVLPFNNLSGDSAHDTLADGLSESIILMLSKIPTMFVIARTSTFTYKGRPVKVQQVAEELGIQFVLEGSVQRSGERVRIATQLIDALTGHHLWSERYEREVNDVFALQDDITQEVVTALQVELTEGEQARVWRGQTNDAKAYEYYLRGLESWRRLTKTNNEKAQLLFEKAVDVDSGFVVAWIELARTHYLAARFGWSDKPTEAAALATKFAEKAVAIDDTQSDAYAMLSNIALLGHQHDEAMTYCEKALSLHPGAEVMAHCARNYSYMGKSEESLELIKRAMRLSPYYPAWYLAILGNAYRLTGDYDRATSALEGWRERDPDTVLVHNALAYTYGLAGREEDAQAAVTETLKRNPRFSIRRFAKALFYKNPAESERILDALRKAGLPENPPLKLPDKPSIAVLPFANMSGDPEQEYFIDGMTDDLITDLSKISGMFVIARNSSFTYKGKTVDVRDVARDLGVRYILEGSVRRAGDMVRINAQLIDATTGGHLWAERYDGLLDDVFELQDKVTQNIVAALAINLTAGEQERQARTETNSPEAYDAFLRGWAHYQLHTPEDLSKAIPYLEEAVELDPNYGRAHAALATVYFDISNLQWHKSAGISLSEAQAKARQQLEEALKDPTPLAHRVASKVRVDQHRWEEAVAEAGQAIALDANDPNGYAEMGRLLVKVGRPAEGLEHIETAMRLDPQTDYLYRLGDAQFQLERYDEAAATMLRATKRNPDDEWNFLLLAAAYGYLGREQEAKSAIDRFNEMRKKVGMHPYTLADIDDWYFKDPAARERLREGLRRGGLPTAKSVPRVTALSPDELRSLFAGNTATGDSARGKWHVYWAPDGKAFMRSFSGRTDQGTWEINDDGEFCRQFANFAGGRKACFIYVKKGEEYEIWTADRSRKRGTLRVRPGNPENL